jgi:glutamate-1-semialdehyde 2,1-aminomutase
MRIVAIIQARMGSVRFPGKVMKEVNGQPLIGFLLKRLSMSKKLDEIILATSEESSEGPLVDYVSELGFRVFQGSEKDVLKRYYDASKFAEADTVIRITGDCPLVDPDLVDHVINTYQKANVDFASIGKPATFPDGLDTAVFSFKALERSFLEATNQKHREHVTAYIHENESFSRINIENDENLTSERWTVDEPEDFEVISNILQHFSPRIDFGWREVLHLSRTSPELFESNKGIVRNEGAAIIGTGQKLWKRAKRVIPGGNMLLSKRSEMFLPNYWPSYYSKAKGCKVWDLDGNEFTDMSIMGIGTNILGYGNDEVDEAVREVVTKGNMSTFNCPEEVYLAERLCEIHPWADMARFARSGGEANAMAIRIARAAAGRSKVAFCGYHGWHDWYLAANLNEGSGLTSHLLPGLEPNGVPDNLKDTVFPFEYNDYETLEKLVREQEVGVIKMEVMRNIPPKDNFLEKVRALADKHNVVLIFDECTSGFRQTFGGLHKQYGVEPDMAMFGKALGNGYAITAVIGRREVMEAAQTTFISSTFWTERIGPTAALKTLDIMEKEKSWLKITETGKVIAEGWEKLGAKFDLPIEAFGLPSLIKFRINSPDMIKYKTLITQEMLKKGFLAGNSVYVSTAHTKDVLDDYFDAVEPVFATIKECEEGRNIDSLLIGPVSHAEFKRIN